MNQRYAGIVTAGTNLTHHENEVLDALIRDGIRSVVDAPRTPANLRRYSKSEAQFDEEQTHFERWDERDSDDAGIPMRGEI